MKSEEPRSSLKSLFYNRISVAGATLAFGSIGLFLLFFLVDVTSAQASPYISLIAYIIIPAFLILGLLLIVLGMLLEERRRIREAPAAVPPLPVIDLNNPEHLRGVWLFFSLAGIFLVLTALGSYKAYNYTDSVEFCGTLCHQVMKPEYTAYLTSPHARVRCVDCHVGPGTSWYIRTKLSGLYQVYATIANKYPRPVTSPVANLRPAKGTCEQCHWPRMFYGSQMKVVTNYGNDEKNTIRQIDLMMKTGGGDPATGPVTGIHWHMSIANNVSYISDEQRQNIWYVRLESRDGKVVREYTSSEKGGNGSVRTMDCIDCHNRPSHIFPPPTGSVDKALLAGRIDPELPFIRKQSVDALARSYPSSQEAIEQINSQIQSFYREKYPGILEDKGSSLGAALEEIDQICRDTKFPVMKVDWKTHPDNIGHKIFPGCFRCHDGNHRSESGETIRNDCDICHTIILQREGSAPLKAVPGQAFRHPADIGDLTRVKCSDCHTGGG